MVPGRCSSSRWNWLRWDWLCWLRLKLLLMCAMVWLRLRISVVVILVLTCQSWELGKQLGSHEVCFRSLEVHNAVVEVLKLHLHGFDPSPLWWRPIQPLVDLCVSSLA